MPARRSPSRDRPIGVLITGVGTLSTGHQAYKSLQLARRRYRITVTNTNAEAMVVANGARRLVLPPADHPDYVRRLAAAANAARARFIIPGSDPELLRIVRDLAVLARLTPAIPLVNNAETIRLCADRHATAGVLARAGFRTPQTADCPSAEAAVASRRAHGLRYPVVIKPREGGGGSADVYLVQDDAELTFFATYVTRNGSAVVLQEYVGDVDSEYTIGVVCYPDGSLGGSIALRRHLSGLLSTRLRVPNRSGRPELGRFLVVSSGFTQGVIDDFPVVRAAAERIAIALKSTGPLNLQGRLVGSDFVVYEINPRFSGSEAMRAMAGWNGPEALIAWHLGARYPLRRVRPRRATFIRGLVEYAVPS